MPNLALVDSQVEARDPAGEVSPPRHPASPANTLRNQLARVDGRMQWMFAMASARLFRRQVVICRGEVARDCRGIIQSISLGPKGEMRASVRLDGDQRKRVIVPVSHLEIGEVDKWAVGDPETFQTAKHAKKLRRIQRNRKRLMVRRG